MDTTTRTTTAPPSTPTSSPATNNTSSEPIPVLPGAAPAFSTTDSATYANITIDDFSPLLSFSNNTGIAPRGDWVTPLTDSDLSGVGTARPNPQREWYLGTYMRTDTVNASITLAFEGSEVHLYGDTGPAYGAYSVSVDDGTPDLKSAYEAEMAGGPAHYLMGVRNLTEGNHTLTIVNRGTREGLKEGKAFLLDYVVVRQRVGPIPGDNQEPKISDIAGQDLQKLNTTRSWALVTSQEDVVTVQGVNASQPKVWYESAEKGAQIGHEFGNITAIQVYGTRNATHGAYSASLSSSNNPSFAPITSTFNASIPCGFGSDTTNTTGTAANTPSNVLPDCEWSGTILKFSAANLDPTSVYSLTLENTDERGGVLSVGLVRTFGRDGEVVQAGAFPQSLGGGSGNSSTEGQGGNEGGGGNGGNGAARLGPGMPELALLLIAWVFVWRGMFGRYV